MKPVFVAAAFVATFAFCVPESAQAQEPKRKPAAAPTVQAPPEQSAPRDAAVPREAVAPRDVAPKSTPRTEPIRGDGTRLEPSATARSNDTDEGQRRGAVRRPPSDGGRGGGTSSPRDRAVARTSPPPRDWDGDRRNRDRVYYYPSYWSYGRYYDPYYYNGFHLGYLSYAPWGWTPAFYGYPYAYGGQQYRGFDMGSLRIKVKPRDAEVYVDGYYAGNVDDFDGVFQSLKLETGGYKIEIRKPGFETLHLDVHVQPDRTITYRGEMSATP